MVATYNFGSVYEHFSIFFYFLFKSFVKVELSFHNNSVHYS